MSTDFNFDINDDLQVGDDYQQPSNAVRPPLPGNYRFKIEKWDYRKTKNGELMLWKNSDGKPTYPVVSLTTAEITDPFEFGRKTVLFQDIPSSPFERDGKVVSQTADLLRVLNPQATAANSSEVLTQLADALNSGQEFRARLDYKAYDKNYAQQLVQQLGPNASKKDINAAYRKAEIRGYKKIKASNMQSGHMNLPLHKWAGPSGTVVDCQPVLTVFFAEGDDVKLGPNADVQ